MSRDAPGFLDRWSARKRAARAEAEAETEAETPDAAAPETATETDLRAHISEEDAATLSDAEICARLDLPDPATLDHGADFGAFLRGGAPKRLQRLALRRLWAVSPHGAALDGLVDYAEDFTDAAVAVSQLSTTYEVGKGLKAHVDALAREAEDAAGTPAERAAAGPVEPDAAAPDETAAAALAVDNADREEGKDDSVIRETAPDCDNETSESSEKSPPRKPRRMAFRFETD